MLRRATAVRPLLCRPPAIEPRRIPTLYAIPKFAAQALAINDWTSFARGKLPHVRRNTRSKSANN